MTDIAIVLYNYTFYNYSAFPIIFQVKITVLYTTVLFLSVFVSFLFLLFVHSSTEEQTQKTESGWLTVNLPSSQTECHLCIYT